MLASVQAEFEKQGVYFLNLTVEEDDDKAVVTQWLSDHNASSLHAGSASSSASKTLHQMAGIDAGGIPASIFIKADGTIAGGHMGMAKREEIVANAKSILP